MSIRKRLLLLLLALLVPLLLLQAFTFFKWYQERKESEMEANLELARTTAKAFDGFIQNTLQSELVIGLAATTSPAPSAEQLHRIVSHATKHNESYRGYAWVSPDGIVRAATTPASDKVDFSKEDYFAKIVSGRDWVVSDLFTSQVTGKPIFAVCTGIRDSGHNLLGVVAAAVHPDKLDHLLAVERSKDAGISLIDSKGLHVYRYPPTNYSPEQQNWLKVYPVIEQVLKGKEIAPSRYSLRIQRPHTGDHVTQES